MNNGLSRTMEKQSSSNCPGKLRFIPNKKKMVFSILIHLFAKKIPLKINTIVFKEGTDSLRNVWKTDILKYFVLFEMFNMTQRSGRKPYDAYNS